MDQIIAEQSPGHVVDYKLYGNYRFICFTVNIVTITLMFQETQPIRDTDTAADTGDLADPDLATISISTPGTPELNSLYLVIIKMTGITTVFKTTAFGVTSVVLTKIDDHMFPKTMEIQFDFSFTATHDTA